MKVFVAGCGRWGSFIATYCSWLGYDSYIWGRSGSARLAALADTRRNEYLTLPAGVTVTDRLTDAVGADILVIAVESGALRELAGRLSALPIAGTRVVLCMKGLETGSGLRLSQVAEEYLGGICPVAVWLGPGHVQDFCRGIPNCMVIDSSDAETKDYLVRRLSGNLIRFYYGDDLIGNELGAASKNVIGIAAGMLDGLQLTSLKGALMSRATREIARLIEAEGGRGSSSSGLCHLGDYEATIFSPHSHNRAFGEAFALGKPYGLLAEGVNTAAALAVLRKRDGVELPICEAVELTVAGKLTPREAVARLFERSLKHEFE